MPIADDIVRPRPAPQSTAEPARRFALELARAPLADDERAALFPDFILAPGGIGIAARAVWAGRGARRDGLGKAGAGPFLVLGEGILRAPPRGGRASPCLSAVALSIAGADSPADALSPGRVLGSCGWETPELLARAADARQRLVAAEAAGEWWQRDGEGELPARNDLALVCLAEPIAADGARAPSAAVLAAMVAAALGENPAERVVLLTAGMAGSGAELRRVLADAAAAGAAIIAGPLDPWAGIARAARVYTAGGEAGFLALLAGREVRAFCQSFYTGWGATVDAPSVKRRPFRRPVDEIFAGACLMASRYLDPFRRKPAGFEEVLDIVAEWRKLETANRHIAACVGMSFWKRRRVADFLRTTGQSPLFRRRSAAALMAAQRRGGAIAVWASRIPPGLSEAAQRRGVPLIRVEDGFIRSVGLGADFMPPASLVFDSRGMYYDPRASSDLEILLREAELGPALKQRARRLIAQLCVRGITKYNLANDAVPIDWPAGRRRIFVPGQVEDDLSVRFGGGQIQTNLDLLTRVRSANPEAFILYKPHPDVAAGHRKGAVPAGSARQFADLVVEAASMPALLGEIDELHTLTSLAGFEALLRRKRVVVYGRPFYAGWGLTVDVPELSRGRRLSLEELVAGTLILYPRYLDPVTRLPCGPEIVIERLDNPELWRPGPLVRARRLQGLAMRRWRDFATRQAATRPGH